MNYFKRAALIFLSISSLASVSANALELTPYEGCLNTVMQQATDEMTVADIKQACIRQKTASLPLEKRRLNEQLTEDNPFVLTPHLLNYAIIGHYTNSVNKAPFEDNVGHPLDFKDQELQFQLSFKFPLAKDLPVLGRNIDLYAAYTNRSFWQFFDDKDSIPFRETNHEPEVWAEFHADLDFLEYNLHKVAIGLSHQSNGQSGSLSRGWNRLYVQGFLQHKNSYLSFKTWQRFEESDKIDNRFDYAKYLGDYEIEAAYKVREHSFGLKVRNRYILNKYGSVQLDYTYPLTKRLKGYIQWFSGYGESLIDLDYHTNKIGIGIVLADRI
ncbi:phospholipase A [Thiomicrorhabdus arctica]|uniref:phospholipase A n=1 Tax=Thiomicrorhabdus arctica TaxID=131540 RepID=UPI00037BC179|nr:phospholipase A [Thiomicrorhabdus arctica]